MSFTRFNKVQKKFNAEISDNATFITLKELFNNDDTDVYKIEMFFINKKSKFGEHYVVYTGDYLVDMPQHLNSSFDEIYHDDTAVDEINNGKAGFTIYKYTKNHKEYYSITFVDYK